MPARGRRNGRAGNHPPTHLSTRPAARLEMNCGCTVENNVIKMCRMHEEAAPKQLEAAEGLVEAHDRAHAEAAKDPDNKYNLPSGMVKAIWNIEDVLNG